MTDDKFPTPTRYTDGRYSREYDEQAAGDGLALLIRVALTNPADLRGFIAANYSAEYAKHPPARVHPPRFTPGQRLLLTAWGAMGFFAVLLAVWGQP